MSKSRTLDASISWSDLDRMGYEELSSLSQAHQEILQSGRVDEVRRVAPLHVLELNGEAEFGEQSRINVLRYLEEKVLSGEIDSLTLEQLRTSSPVSFQRIRDDKSTGTFVLNRGKLVESVYVFPNGTRIRTFHNVFNDPDRKHRALKGQEFYAGLADYVRKRFENRNSLTSDEQAVYDRVKQLATLMPLHSTRNSLDNIFVNGKDLKEELKNAGVDKRVEYLQEISDIDLIMGFFSKEFRQTSAGRKIYRKGFWKRKNLFSPKDYRREVFEEIILGADKEFAFKLKQAGVLHQDGAIVDEEAFSVFYSGTEHAKVLDLLGVSDNNVQAQQFFTSGDLNLGNVLVRVNGRRIYTPIDFESSREDCLEAQLAKRWVESGVYNHDGESLALEEGRKAEEVLLHEAYLTLSRLGRISGESVPSLEEFVDNFKFQKRKFLLRLARRYKVYEATDEDPEKMSALKRYFYTMFVGELEKEGRINSAQDSRLTYLNTLFGEPLSGNEMRRIFDEYNASFTSSSDINPLSTKDKEASLELLAEDIARHKRLVKLRKAKRLGAYIGLPLILVSLAAGVKIAYDSHQREVGELQERVERGEEMLSIAEKTHVVKLFYEGQKEPDDYSNIGLYELVAWMDAFPEDKKTAVAAFFDHKRVNEAIMATGKKDWESIEYYLWNNDQMGIVIDVINATQNYLDMPMRPGFNFLGTSNQDNARERVRGLILQDMQELPDMQEYEKRRQAQ